MTKGLMVVELSKILNVVSFLNPVHLHFISLQPNPCVSKRIFLPAQLLSSTTDWPNL